jgi:hypothetical protein
MTNTITGLIVNSRQCKNNVHYYWIKDTKGNTEKYVYFGKIDNDNLDNSRQITVKYDTENNNYGKQNKIKKFTYRVVTSILSL